MIWIFLAFVLEAVLATWALYRYHAMREERDAAVETRDVAEGCFGSVIDANKRLADQVAYLKTECMRRTSPQVQIVGDMEVWTNPAPPPVVMEAATYPVPDGWDRVRH